MSPPEKSQVFFSEIWKIRNLRQYINGRAYIRQNNAHPPPISVSSIAPHIFCLGKHSNKSNEVSLKAQAKLSVDEDSKMILITISLVDRNESPSWAVAMKFSTIAIRDAPGHSSFTYMNLHGDPDERKESNLRTSNCVSPLFHIDSAASYIAETRDSLTIDFGVWCMITNTAELPVTANADLQLCGFQALDDFETLWKDKSSADFEIKVTLGKHKTFHCHKSILAARSPMLHAMFQSPMKESQENRMEVDDMTAKTMEHFLSFLYCGRFQNESWVKSLPHLTYASDKYCVNSLKQFCDSNLIRSVTCKNAIALADLAQLHQLPKAISAIRIFIGNNARKLNLDLEVASEAIHYF